MQVERSRVRCRSSVRVRVRGFPSDPSPPKEVRHEARELVDCVFLVSARWGSRVGPDCGRLGTDRYDIAPADHARSLPGRGRAGADPPADDRRPGRRGDPDRRSPPGRLGPGIPGAGPVRSRRGQREAAGRSGRGQGKAGIRSKASERMARASSRRNWRRRRPAPRWPRSSSIAAPSAHRSRAAS